MNNNTISNYIPYVDHTSSSNETAFTENSAVSDNLSSIMKNHIVILDKVKGEEENTFPK